MGEKTALDPHRQRSRSRLPRRPSLRALVCAALRDLVHLPDLPSDRWILNPVAAPDAVPRRQFGLVSGVQGATYTLGVVGGTLIAALAGVELGYLISAGVVVLFVAIFAASGAWKCGLVGTGSTTDMLLAEGEESLARGYSDFIWVFIARFAINLGNYVALFYLLYFLRDRIRLADPETGVLILTGVYALSVIISTIIGGMWSDRVGRRKPFYLAAGVGIALACVLMAIATTFPAAIAGAIMLGLVWGLFTAVDQALVNSVLPVPDKRARDVGVMTVAIAAANIASPLFAAFCLGRLGGYPGLYLASGPWSSSDRSRSSPSTPSAERGGEGGAQPTTPPRRRGRLSRSPAE